MDRRLSTPTRLVLAALALSTLAGLAGCGDRMGDLREYTNEVKARKGGRIEPPPQIKPFETFIYNDGDQRSPFMPQLEALASNAAKNTSTTGLHPDFNRNREYLEQFPLDGLKMVGTLTVSGTLFALVKDSDNILHRVNDGNYMGQNYGKIISITDSEIKLREIVPDGQGGWSERVTTVTLSE
ncbi:MAG TPA: pilus assembly protein PilP [Gammaproteobacteria bacterium]|nr:pilus assembly protein PilP [Gammaproteobacteria bacterium]